MKLTVKWFLALCAFVAFICTNVLFILNEFEIDSIILTGNAAVFLGISAVAGIGTACGIGCFYNLNTVLVEIPLNKEENEDDE